MCRARGPRLPLHCKKAVSGLGHSSMVEDFSSKHQSLNSNANPETTPTNPSCRVPTRVSVIAHTAKAGPSLSFCGPGNETGPCTCCPSALPLSDVYRHQKAFDHFADEETEAQSLLTCATQVTNEQRLDLDSELKLASVLWLSGCILPVWPARKTVAELKWLAVSRTLGGQWLYVRQP